MNLDRVVNPPAMPQARSGSARSRSPAAGLGGGEGFSLVELLTVIVALGVVAAVGYGAFTQYNEATIANRASRVLAGDIALTRAYAVQRRENVSLKADEADRRYVIRTPAGDTFGIGSFTANSDMPLTTLDVEVTGDSLTFDSRGLLVIPPASSAEVALARFEQTRTVRVSPLGRTEITNP